MQPVFYQNAMMEQSSADYFRGSPPSPGVFDGDNVEVTGNLTPGMKVQVPRS